MNNFLLLYSKLKAHYKMKFCFQTGKLTYVSGQTNQMPYSTSESLTISMFNSQNRREDPQESLIMLSSLSEPVQHLSLSVIKPANGESTDAQISSGFYLIPCIRPVCLRNSTCCCVSKCVGAPLTEWGSSEDTNMAMIPLSYTFGAARGLPLRDL